MLAGRKRPFTRLAVKKRRQAHVHGDHPGVINRGEEVRGRLSRDTVRHARGLLAGAGRDPADARSWAEGAPTGGVRRSHEPRPQDRDVQLALLLEIRRLIPRPS